MNTEDLQIELDYMRNLAAQLWQYAKAFDLNDEMDANYFEGRVTLDELHDWAALKVQCEVEFDGMHQWLLPENNGV